MALLFCVAAGGQQFEDVTVASGVRFQHRADKSPEKRLVETMGSGVAVDDFDGDGGLDLFFVTGSGTGNQLYLNRGGFKFEEAASQASVAGEGRGMGAAAGDLDGDGDIDLVATGLDALIFYRNRGGASFDTIRLPVKGWLAAAALLDFNSDGRLDIFVSRYLDWDFARSRWCGENEPGRRSYCHPREFGPVTHLLFRNLGDGRFEDVSARVGLERYPGKGLGVAVNDYDGDGYPDVFVANDSYPQQLFRNVDGQRFEEAGVAAGVAYDDDGQDFAGMGAVFEDYDNDGRPDIFVNALGRQGYWLYRNAGAGEFEAVSGPAGIAGPSEMRSGWGAALADLDNDGWRDLFVAQGHVMDDIERTDPALAYREPLMLLRNLFGRFYDRSSQAGPAFREPRAARGAVAADLDGDGRLDLVVSTNDGAAVVLGNVTPNAGGWLGVRAPIGSKVRVRLSSGRELHGYSSGAGSYLSSKPPSVHFGLGDEQPEEVVVTFPGGEVAKETKPEAGKVLQFTPR